MMTITFIMKAIATMRHPRTRTEGGTGKAASQTRLSHSSVPSCRTAAEDGNGQRKWAPSAIVFGNIAGPELRSIHRGPQR